MESIVPKDSRWTIIIDDIKISNKYTYCWCRCQCGKYRLISKYNIIRSESKSCGCYGKEIAKINIGKYHEKYRRERIEFPHNHKINNLTILIDNIKIQEDRKYYLWCKCDCGKYKLINRSLVKTHQARSCGCLHKKSSRKNVAQINKIQKKEKHPSWKGGSSIFGSEAHVKRRLIALNNDSKCRNYAPPNISVLDLQKLLIEHDKSCDICKKLMITNSKNQNKLCIDHCHITGKVRGLICSNCNTAIGRFNDDPQILINAAKYLIDNA